MAFWRWINVNSKIHLIECQKILLRNRATWFVWYQRSNLLLSRLKKCTNTLNQGQEGLNHKIMIRSHYWTSKFGRLCCLQWSYPKLPSFFIQHSMNYYWFVVVVFRKCVYPKKCIVEKKSLRIDKHVNRLLLLETNFQF